MLIPGDSERCEKGFHLSVHFRSSLFFGLDEVGVVD
jgi:hypothetical protein